ncbi:acyltransferase family protein [Hyphomonas sp.]|uniref:acyltransferase family protein n=1 Tax=Hyphomonas sp. TaxID=87 RepID=UPI00391A3045
MKLHSIQMLRGLAAMLVVFYHIRASETQMIQRAGGAELPMMGGIFANGYLGVDLFFVISGFIMVFVAGASPASPRTSAEFLFARAARIYPLWWAFAGLMSVYMLLTYGLTGVSETGQTAIGRGIPPLEYLLKSFLLVPQPEYPVLAVGWTLVHEMHFYIVFALILLAPRMFRPWLVALWAGLVIAGALMGLSGPVGGTLLQLATHPMSLEFILGAGAAWLVTSGRRWRPGLITAVAAFWLLFAACFHGEPTAYTLVWGRVLWFGLPCALLVYGFASLDAENRLGALAAPVIGAVAGAAIFHSFALPVSAPDAVRLQASLLAVGSGGAICFFLSAVGYLSGRLGGGLPGLLTAPGRAAKSAAVALGDWSYALYLAHIFVLQGMQRVFIRLEDLPGGAGAVFNVAADGRLGNITFMTVCLVAAVIAAWLAFRFLELPLIRRAGDMRRRVFTRDGARVRPAEIRATVW